MDRYSRGWWAWKNLNQMPLAGRSMDTITALDRSNLGPVEWAVSLSNMYRENVRDPLVDVGWLDPPGITGRRPTMPTAAQLSVYPEWAKTGAPTAIPRPGLVGQTPEDFSAIELLGFFGLRAKYFDRTDIVVDRMFDEQRRHWDRKAAEFKASDPVAPDISDPYRRVPIERPPED